MEENDAFHQEFYDCIKDEEVKTLVIEFYETENKRLLQAIKESKVNMAKDIINHRIDGINNISINDMVKHHTENIETNSKRMNNNKEKIELIKKS